LIVESGPSSDSCRRAGEPRAVLHMQVQFWQLQIRLNEFQLAQAGDIDVMAGEAHGQT
jgi:hypothetical protein